jgi:hypothetical protein
VFNCFCSIRKWVRAPEATQPAYQRCATFNKLRPFHDTLEQALKADSLWAKHNRRSAKALFEQIKAEGYDGGYSQLTAFVRSWRGEQGKSLRAFVPLTFALGEAFQFDWSEEGLLIGSLFRRIQVSHMKLCASRAFWLVAYPARRHNSGSRHSLFRRRGRPAQSLMPSSPQPRPHAFPSLKSGLQSCLFVQPSALFSSSGVPRLLARRPPFQAQFHALFPHKSIR